MLEIDSLPPLSSEQRWLVGTGEHCDVRVTDDYASREHCVVARAGARFYVIDVGSTNGTYLRTPEGQIIRVGAWTEILPGMTLVVGRSQIPWRP